VSALSVGTTTRLLRVGLDLLTLLLVVLVIVDSRCDAAAVVTAVVFLLLYGVGRWVVWPTGLPGSMRGRWWPDTAWIAALAVLWLLLLVTAGVPAIWLAFPLAVLQMHVLGPHRGVLAVVLTTAAAVGTGLALGLDPMGAVLGPSLGAALAVGVVVGLETVLRESAERQALIDELIATRRQLAATEHERGVSAERERLAREIHDMVAQGLSSIELLLRVVEETGDLAQVHKAREVARKNLAEVRQIVAALAPADLSGATLEEALSRVVHRTTGPVVHWTVTGRSREVDVTTSAALVRIAQSALANVTRHAHADRVDVTLSYLDDSVLLDIVDDGVGFDPNESGFGLSVLRARAEEVGGHAVIESAVGCGTAVAVEVPA